jgi:hypothetical protein
MATSNFTTSNYGKTFAFWYEPNATEPNGTATDFVGCDYEEQIYYDDLVEAFNLLKDEIYNDFFDIELKSGYYYGATVVITEKQTEYGQFYNDDELLEFAYKSLIFDNEKKIYKYEEMNYDIKPCQSVAIWQIKADADTMEECERILPLFKVFIENHINSTLERVEAKIKAFAGLYGGKEIKGAMRFSNGECIYNYAN